MRIPKTRFQETDPIPTGFGLCYWDFKKYEAVCYPIPFNVLIAWLRDTYFKLFIWSDKTKTERILKRAYFRGLKNGRSESMGHSYELGLRSGARAGQTMLKLAKGLFYETKKD